MSENKTIIEPGSINTISTVEKSGKRKWQYAFKPSGKLYNLRTVLSFFYLGIFFLLPFLKYKGMPMFQFNFPDRVFIIFGKIFLPQDYIIFGVAFLVALLFIIIFTLIFGRVFCGWICPQTIFLEMVFRKIEFWIEGPAHKQKIADKSKWTTQLWMKKILKHAIYLFISFLIANTFLSYIIGVDELFKIIREPVSQHIQGFLSIIFFTLVFYSVFAFVREIVCIVICPYGRLQSVLLDKNSVVVAYDYLRGEPRSKKREESKGDCIDCNMCVNVCPTGIDIRNGTQMECVNCTACIDACNMMMAKVNRPPDLIKFASENNIATRQKTKFTTRMAIYSVVLLALVGLLSFLIAKQKIFEAEVLRAGGVVLQEQPDGTITNLYRLKAVNKSRNTEPFLIKLQEQNAELIITGKKIDSLKAGQEIDEQFFIKRKKTDIKSRKEYFHLDIYQGQRVIDTKEVIFIGEY